MAAFREWIGRFLFTGSAAERLGATRLLLGLGLVPFHATQYAELLSVDLLGPRWYYLDRVWYFDLLDIRYHEPIVVAVAFAALLVATVCFAVGYHTRTAAWTSLLLILFLKGARDSFAGDIHHRELIPFNLLLFFALSRCGDALSVDARRRSTRPLEEWEASWPIQASQLYVAAFYFWSGVAKLRVSGVAWIASGTSLQGLLARRTLRFDGEAAAGASGGSLGLWMAGHPDALHLLAIGTLAVELAFLILPFVRARWYRAVYLTGLTFFHIANFVLLQVLFLFLPVVFVVFLDPTRIGRALARRLGFSPKAR